MTNSYKEAIKINKYELQDLWEDHCDRFITWWEAYAESKRQRDILDAQLTLKRKENKREIEELNAELIIEIRKKPNAFGLSKATDASVEACVLIQPRYKRMRKELAEEERELWMKFIDAEHSMMVLKGAAEGFDMRTDALRALTSLMTGGLYSAKLPTGPIKTEIEAKKAAEKRQDLQRVMEERKSDKGEA